MKTSASVCVVIPCYNAENTIGRAIESIMSQTLLPQEIIIVDDRSQDASCEVISGYIERYKEHICITLITLEQNSGPAKARNVGWNSAKADYIAFLDADDSWHSQKIELQYNYMLSHLEVMLSGHLYEVVNQEQVLIPPQQIEKTEEITKRKMLIRNRFSTPTVMMKRNITLRFREHKKYSEDYLLWLEIVLYSNKCVLLHIPLCYLYKPAYGVSGLSQNMAAMWKGGLQNYQILYREGHIGIFLYLLLIVYRTLKFIRMVIKSKLKNTRL